MDKRALSRILLVGDAPQDVDLTSQFVNAVGPAIQLNSKENAAQNHGSKHGYYVFREKRVKFVAVRTCDFATQWSNGRIGGVSLEKLAGVLILSDAKSALPSVKCLDAAVEDGISSDVEKSVSKMHSTLMMMDCKTMGLEQAFAEFLSNLPATGDRERRKRKRDTEAPSGEPLSEPLTSSEEITEPVSPRQGKDRKVRRRSLAHSAGEKFSRRASLMAKTFTKSDKRRRMEADGDFGISKMATFEEIVFSDDELMRKSFFRVNNTFKGFDDKKLMEAFGDIASKYGKSADAIGRIVTAVLHWIEQICPAEFDTNLVSGVKNLTSRLQTICPEKCDSTSLSQTWKAKRREIRQCHREVLPAEPQPVTPQMFMSKVGSMFQYMKGNESAFAAVLHASCANLFVQCPPMELYHAAFQRYLPNYSALANFLKRLSNWTTSMLLFEEDVKTRIQLQQWFVRVATKSRELGNVAAAFEITLAVERSPVDRLKTYEAIKHDIKWKELKKLTDVAQNLKMLKDETERQHHKKRPTVPPLPMWGSVFNYIHANHESDEDRLNMTRSWLLATKFQFIEECQELCANIANKRDDTHERMRQIIESELPFTDEEEWWSKSYSYEPAGGTHTSVSDSDLAVSLPTEDPPLPKQRSHDLVRSIPDQPSQTPNRPRSSSAHSFLDSPAMGLKLPDSIRQQVPTSSAEGEMHDMDVSEDVVTRSVPLERSMSVSVFAGMCPQTETEPPSMAGMMRKSLFEDARKIETAEQAIAQINEWIARCRDSVTGPAFCEHLSLCSGIPILLARSVIRRNAGVQRVLKKLFELLFIRFPASQEEHGFSDYVSLFGVLADCQLASQIDSVVRCVYKTEAMRQLGKEVATETKAFVEFQEEYLSKYPKGFPSVIDDEALEDALIFHAKLSRSVEISTEWAKQLTSQCDKFVAIRQTVVDAIKSYSAEMELKLSSNSTPEIPQEVIACKLKSEACSREKSQLDKALKASVAVQKQRDIEIKKLEKRLEELKREQEEGAKQISQLKLKRKGVESELKISKTAAIKGEREWKASCEKEHSETQQQVDKLKPVVSFIEQWAERAQARNQETVINPLQNECKRRDVSEKKIQSTIIALCHETRRMWDAQKRWLAVIHQDAEEVQTVKDMEENDSEEELREKHGNFLKAVAERKELEQIMNKAAAASCMLCKHTFRFTLNQETDTVLNAVRERDAEVQTAWKDVLQMSGRWLSS